VVACRKPAGLSSGAFEGRNLPSLFRFLIVVGVLAGLAYAGMWALVTFVEPQQREMSKALPPNALAGK